MFKLIGGALSQYKLAVIVTVVVSLLGTFGGMYWKIKTLTEEVDQLKAVVTAAEIVNKNNTTTISELETNLTQNAASCNARVEAIRSTLEERDKTLGELDALYQLTRSASESCTATVSDYEARKRAAERERDRLRNEVATLRVIPAEGASSASETGSIPMIEVPVSEKPYYEEAWYIQDYLNAIVPPDVSGLLQSVKRNRAGGTPSQ